MQEEKRKVLSFIAEGLTDEEISERLGVSRGTTRNRILELFSESGIRTRCGLITWGFRNGYIK